MSLLSDYTQYLKSLLSVVAACGHGVRPDTLCHPHLPFMTVSVQGTKKIDSTGATLNIDFNAENKENPLREWNLHVVELYIL